MNEEKCRLCLDGIDDRTGLSITEGEFRTMAEFVFSFKIILDSDMPEKVCLQCLETVQSFYTYSRQVEANQNSLQREYGLLEGTQDDVLSIKYEPVNNDNVTVSELVGFIKCEEYKITENIEFPAETNPDRSNSNTHDPELSRQQLNQGTNLQSDSYCNLCDKLFSSAKTLKNHNGRKHSTLPDDQMLRCDQCESSFSNEIALKYHQHTHKLAKCKLCDKSVVKRFLKEHTAAHQGAIRCEKCDKMFSSWRSLKLHNKLIHAPDQTDAPKLRCQECERSFWNQAQLNSHQRSHQPQECPVCKKLCSKSSIKDHIAAHNGAFSCNICEGTFSSKRRLRTHMSLKHSSKDALADHREFGCHQCDRSFSNETQLKAHLRYHTRQKCPICMKSITVKNMQAHIANHAYRDS